MAKMIDYSYLMGKGKKVIPFWPEKIDLYEF